MWKNLLTRRSPRVKNSAKHPLQYVTIVYNFAFDVGQPINPTNLARRVLKTDIAIAAANYAGDDIEVAKYFANLERDVRKLERIERALTRPTGWRQAFAMLRIAPITTLRSLRLGRNSHDPDEGDDGHGMRELVASLKQLREDVAVGMLRAQTFAAMKRDVDRQVLRPQYEAEVPLSRVSLQSFFGHARAIDLAVDVELAIHRSGIAILSFYVVLDGEMSADEVAGFSIASRVEVTELRIPEILMRQLAALQGFDHTTIGGPRDQSRGIRWIEPQFEEPLTLSDVFELYRDVVVSVASEKSVWGIGRVSSLQRDDSWFAYPVIHVGQIGDGLDDVDALESTQRELLDTLLIRAKNPDVRRKSDSYAPSNTATTADHALYLGATHGVVVYFRQIWDRIDLGKGDFPGNDWIGIYFHHGLVVDLLLLQYWILEVLNTRAKRLLSAKRDVLDLYAEILVGLEDYFLVAPTSYLEPRDMIAKARTLLRVPQLYDSLMARVQIAERLIDARAQARRARRDRALQVLSLLITLALGFSASNNLVTAIATTDLSEWPSGIPGRQLMASVVALANNYSAIVTLLIYLLIVVVAVMVIGWSVWPRMSSSPLVSDVSRSASQRGNVWPGTRISRSEEGSERVPFLRVDSSHLD